MKVVVQRKNKAVHFQGTNENGNSINMDGSPAIGGEDKGVRPMEMLLMGLAGCSGIDVVSILKKQKIEDFDLNIEVDGNRVDETPAVFDKIHVKFIFNGNDLKESKLIRAVQLSVDKYCSVGMILKEAAEIDYSISLNGETLEQ